MLSEVRIDSLSCNEGSSIIGDSPEKLTIEAWLLEWEQSITHISHKFTLTERKSERLNGLLQHCIYKSVSDPERLDRDFSPEKNFFQNFSFVFQKSVLKKVWTVKNFEKFNLAGFRPNSKIIGNFRKNWKILWTFY